MSQRNVGKYAPLITIWKVIACSHAQEWIKLEVGLLCILTTHCSIDIYKISPKCIKDCAKIVSVEITLPNSNKVIICCVYRAPNTDLSMLSEFLTNILRNVRKNKVYMCGDFNIDLLQFDKHGATNEFIDQIYTLGLHPLVTRPTRITSHSKTLIDNIFTSDLSSQIHSGLIINDTSDHLPIYQITEYAHCKNKKIPCNRRRIVNEKNIAVLINDLKETNWNTVIHSENVNVMYDTFSEKLANSYNKNCQIVNEKVKKTGADKPWITKSLINACKKKKNLLYREFLKNERINVNQNTKDTKTN